MTRKAVRKPSKIKAFDEPAPMFPGIDWRQFNHQHHQERAGRVMAKAAPVILKSLQDGAVAAVHAEPAPIAPESPAEIERRLDWARREKEIRRRRASVASGLKETT